MKQYCKSRHYVKGRTNLSTGPQAGHCWFRCSFPAAT